jgi:predicted ester cyclase
VSEERGSTSVEQNKATVRRVFEEVLNQGRLDVIDEIYDPHIVDHDPLPGGPTGIEGVRYSIGGLLEAFPDLQVTIEDMSAHGDFVVVHNVWKGTQSGRLLGLPPTGREVTFTGVVIWRLANGLIAERWAVIDLVQQVGVASRRRRSRASAQALDYADAVTSFASLQPLAPEKFEEYKEFVEQLKGPRHAEFVASRKRLGIKREVQWLSVWPRVGDMRFEIGYYEAEDLIKLGVGLAASDDPFDVWFRERVTYLHGFDWNDVAELGAPTELMFEWSAD